MVQNTSKKLPDIESGSFLLVFIYLMNLLAIALTIEITRAPANAFKKPSMTKPSTKDDTNSNKAALITKWNKPKVSIVIGKVSINSTGLTSKFSRPIITAEIIATYKFSIKKPGNKCETSSKASAVTNNRIIINKIIFDDL